MSRQDKATTERNAKTLRELLKRPENKFCSDCKRNDPRWASWNLGVFLCIRCSGIHRSMGTHISKVKSVDLDVWTPEQMASITKWGNRLANLYWEAHLRAGHVPPDHKMDSFIRSKYESKRWAREGPVPSDPSVLDTGSSAPAAQPEPVAAPPPVSAPPRGHAPTSSVSSARATPVTNRQPQPHQLLSTSMTNRPTAQPAAPQPTQAPQQQPVAAQPAQATAANDLFSLDFHNPTPPAPQAQAPKKDVKQDILSLFSTPAPQAAPAYGVAQNQFAAQQPAFGQQPQNVWGAPVAAQPQQPQQPTSMVGQNGVGMWGVSSGWNQAPAAPAQSNLWGQPAAAPAPGLGGYGQPQAAPQQPSLFDTNDIWGSSNAGATGGANLFGGSTTATQQKKDDVFGDIWGGFK